MNLLLTFEVLPGSDIAEVAKDLVQAVQKVGVSVTAEFNGCDLRAGRHTTPDVVVRQYNEYLVQPRPRDTQLEAIATVEPLQYTTELPRANGMYWTRRNRYIGDATIVRVYQDADGRWWAGPKQFGSLANDREWAGPIPDPST